MVWNRQLSAGTGSSTYVFTTILVLFLTGIALGAGMLGVLRPRVRSAVTLIAVAQILTAVFACIGAAILSSPSYPLQGGSSAFVLALGLFAAQAVFIVLPATVAMGITFPATAALLGDETGTEGSATGALLAVNTTGSIVATFVLPFFVIPLIGSPATLAILILINAVVGTVLFRGERRLAPERRRLGVLAGVGVVGLVIVTFVTGAAFQNPTIQLIEGKGGTVFEAAEDEIAATEAGRDRGHAPAVGGRDGDDRCSPSTPSSCPCCRSPCAPTRIVASRSPSAWARPSGRRSTPASRRTPWSWSRPCPG